MGLGDGLGVRLALLVISERPVDAGEAGVLAHALTGGDDQVGSARRTRPHDPLFKNRSVDGHTTHESYRTTIRPGPLRTSPLYRFGVPAVDNVGKVGRGAVG